MPSGFQVTCANEDQQGVIVRVGGAGWSLGLREAVHKIGGQQLRLHIYATVCNPGTTLDKLCR